MSYEERFMNLLVSDAIEILKWILARNGEPAHINDVPGNFNSYQCQWMIHRPGGNLLNARQVASHCFIFRVTGAGIKFLREHSGANSPEELKPLTSAWLLNQNQQICEFKDLSKISTHVLEMLKENNAAVIDGQLWAVSFEDLMGDKNGPTLSVQ